MGPVFLILLIPKRQKEQRKIDKTGCLQLNGVVFEAGAAFIGEKVEVRYDPFDLSLIEIWKDEVLQVKTKPLEIKEFNGRKRQSVIEKAPKTGSRLLRSLEKKKKETLNKKKGVISYKKISKDEENK